MQEQVMKDLPVVQIMVNKSFEKEEDLRLLKLELSRLEKDIAQKVQAKQSKEAKTEQSNSEAKVVTMNQKKCTAILR